MMSVFFLDKFNDKCLEAQRIFMKQVRNLP